MSRNRVLLPDEVATQLTQAFAGNRGVTFEVRKNATVIRLNESCECRGEAGAREAEALAREHECQKQAERRRLQREQLAGGENS